MRVGGPAAGDLLIFEGPSVVRWKGIRPVYDHGDVTMADLPTPDRIEDWIGARVHVQGRPDWIFVKVFTHGALPQDHDAVLGEWAERMYQTLEARYNDGTNYVLHYVTAREAYNIAQAAQAGKSGNPSDYRDFLIPPYASRFLTASVPYTLLSMNDRHVVAQFKAPSSGRVTAHLRAPLARVSGDAGDVSIERSEDGASASFALTGEGIVDFAR